MTDRLKQIATHYGSDNQIRKCVEELTELSLALQHNDYANTVEEIADVEVMLEQIKYLFGIPPRAIQEVKDRKLARQLKRLGG